eukprot:GCRY01006524.1.p1 GENE.GCRY01006524.1~~GCRY01006524.1.p1  ORF type:complete len:141 (-),score=6.48 GCRY01006524.1:1148-1549(-)
MNAKIRYNRLPETLRMKVICLHDGCHSYRKTAKLFNEETDGYSITHEGVRQIIITHKDSPTQLCRSAERSGRPRKTTHRQDRVIKRICLEDRFRNAPVITSIFNTQFPGVALYCSTFLFENSKSQILHFRNSR